MKYRIIEKQGFGFLPQWKSWWSPFWRKFSTETSWRQSFNEAKQIIDDDKYVWSGYYRIYNLYGKDN